MTIKDKNNCFRGCKFKSQKKNIGIALVPPPDKILGIVVSQDPPISWYKDVYKHSKKNSDKENQRLILFKSGIPRLLFNRITEFMGHRIEDEDEKYLRHMLFYKVYWTHLHKCFTGGSKKPLKFQPKNAEQCADWWLKKELGHVISNKTRFIIALGNIVKRTLEKQNISNKYRKLKFIKLPHPSGRNRKWNNKNDTVILEAIQDLLGLCKTVA